MPHHFTIQPHGFRSIRKTVIIRLGMIAIFLILFMVFLQILNPPEPDTPNAWPYMIVILGGIMAFTIFTTLKRQKLVYKSYRLTINGEGITREIINTPPIILRNEDVSKIIKDAKGGFTIIGQSRLNVIGVPAEVERAEELERLLSAIRPITTKISTSWVHILQLPLAFFLVVALFLGISSDSRILSALSTLGFSGLLLGGFILIQFNKNVDRKIKRLSYIVWIPLISLIAGLIIRMMDT